MDNKKFAQDAFERAHRATIEREADAFQEFIDNRGMNTMMSAVAAAGLEKAMHQYEKALLSLAFHEGCQAGRLMEDEK